jgi:hypothetical protein
MPSPLCSIWLNQTIKARHYACAHNAARVCPRVCPYSGGIARDWESPGLKFPECAEMRADFLHDIYLHPGSMLQLQSRRDFVAETWPPSARVKCRLTSLRWTRKLLDSNNKSFDIFRFRYHYRSRLGTLHGLIFRHDRGLSLSLSLSLSLCFSLSPLRNLKNFLDRLYLPGPCSPFALS